VHFPHAVIQRLRRGNRTWVISVSPFDQS